MKYRIDLDSLRAVSMLFVFIYHYNMNILPSGYIGVDIFLVLSGYFNTLTNNSSKKINWIDFYCKRIIRLYPSQLLCLFAVYFNLMQSFAVNFKQEVNYVLGALLGYSNYLFYYSSLDYFQSFNSPSKVLHFWSLSLENQFYLLFPLLYIVIKYKFIFIALLIMLIAISTFESIYYSKLAYYSLSSRLNEFIYGSFLSICNFYTKPINKDFLVLIIIFVTFVNRIKYGIYFPIPFIFLIYPSLYFIIKNDSDSGVLLGSEFLKNLGTISYSFYLFHFPVILYNDKRCLKVFVLKFLITLFLSILSTNLIENYIRSILHKRLISALLFLIIVFFSLILIDSKKKYDMKLKSYINIRSYNNSYMVQSPEDVDFNWSCNLYYKMCWCPFLNNRNQHNEKYLYDNIFGKNVLFLMGDSHLEQWYYLISPYAIKMGYTLLQLYCYTRFIGTHNCDWIFTLLNKFNNKYYAIVSQFLQNNQDKVLTMYIKRLMNIFKFVYVIQDTPHFPYNPNDCLIKQTNKLKCFSILNINSSLIKFPLIKNDRIKYLDFSDFICEDRVCPFIYKGYPVYKDTNHLNLNFTYLLKDIFFRRGFKLNKVNNSGSICNSVIWCREDFSLNVFSFCKSKLIH